MSGNSILIALATVSINYAQLKWQIDLYMTIRSWTFPFPDGVCSLSPKHATQVQYLATNGVSDSFVLNPASLASLSVTH